MSTPSTPRPINLIVLHCSATRNGDPLFSPGQTPIQFLDAVHKAKGFLRGKIASSRFNPTLGHIGYHYVIYTNGAIVAGRAEEEIGAHVKGHNSDSLGVCLIGTDRYTAAQWSALTGVLAALTKRYPRARVVGHRDLSPDLNGDGTIQPREWLKTCPGFDVAAWQRAGTTPPIDHLLEG